MGKSNGKLSLEDIIHALLHNRLITLIGDVLTLVLILYFLYKGNNWLCYFIIGIISFKLFIIAICSFILFRKKMRKRKVLR